MKNPQVQILKETIELTHGLVSWYFAKLADADIYKQFELNGQKLNSIYWIGAHLAWSENDLVLKAINYKPHNAKWLDDFKFGNEHTNHGPTWNKVKQVAKKIHKMSLVAIDKLTDKDLLKENAIGIGFGGKPTIKVALMHQIRHANNHAGHLGWIAKLNGIKTA